MASSKRTLLITGLISLSTTGVLAQSNSSNTPVVDSLRIEGLERTKLSFIAPYLEDVKGGSCDSTRLNHCALRLVQLPQIFHAEAQLDSTSGINIVVISVKEARTSIPVLNFGGIKGNYWTRIGWKDFNVAGRGISTGITHQFHIRHSVSGYFILPQDLINGLGYSLDFTSRHTIEPLFIDDLKADYKYDYNGGMISTFKAINSRKTTGEIGVGVFHEKFTLDDSESDMRFPRASSLSKGWFKYRIQHKDIRQQSLNISGVQAFIQLEQVYTPSYKTWYHIVLSEWSYYQMLGRYTNVAGRLLAGIATNTDSPIAPFILDSYYNIRGAGNIVSRGSASLVLNLELRQQLFYLHNFTGQIVAFSDYGTWRLPGGSFDDFTNPEIVQHFVGGGIRLSYLKLYGSTFRLDYGIDIKHQEKKGFVIGLGQYF